MTFCLQASVGPNADCALSGAHELLAPVWLPCFNRDLRKLLSILLLAAFGLPFASPLLAMSRGERVPSCCRRDGKHHCEGMAGMAAGAEGESQTATAAPRWVRSLERCPYCPASVTTPHLTGLGATETRALYLAALARPARLGWERPRRRTQRDLSRPQRGPPATPLA